MTNKRRDVIADYVRREREAGGYAEADIEALVQQTAEACSVTYDEAKAIMKSHWAGGLAG